VPLVLCNDPAHPDCGTPVAEVEGDTLIIETRHHGERHTSSVALGVDNADEEG
jgi:hypothetical protein